MTLPAKNRTAYRALSRNQRPSLFQVQLGQGIERRGGLIHFLVGSPEVLILILFCQK